MSLATLRCPFVRLCASLPWRRAASWDRMRPPCASRGFCYSARPSARVRVSYSARPPARVRVSYSARPSARLRCSSSSSFALGAAPPRTQRHSRCLPPLRWRPLQWRRLQQCRPLRARLGRSIGLRSRPHRPAAPRGSSARDPRRKMRAPHAADFGPSTAFPKSRVASAARAMAADPVVTVQNAKANASLTTASSRSSNAVRRRAASTSDVAPNTIRRLVVIASSHTARADADRYHRTTRRSTSASTDATGGNAMHRPCRMLSSPTLLRQILATRSCHRSSHRPTQILTGQAQLAIGEADEARRSGNSV